MADSTIKILVNADLVKTIGVLGSTTVALADRYELTLPQGTAAGQADIIVPIELSIAASGNASIDLDALTTIFGDAADSAKLKALLIYHDPDSAASGVTVTGDVLNTLCGSTFSLSLPAGDHLSVSRASAGLTVSASADGITVTNNDATNAATVKIIIFATTA